MPLWSIESPEEAEQRRQAEQAAPGPESRARVLQTELADCFLSSWAFTVGGAAIGLLRSQSVKSFLPVAYGVMAGTIMDVASGCFRCQEQWDALRRHQASLQPPNT